MAWGASSGVDDLMVCARVAAKCRVERRACRTAPGYGSEPDVRTRLEHPPLATARLTLASLELADAAIGFCSAFSRAEPDCPDESAPARRRSPAPPRFRVTAGA